MNEALYLERRRHEGRGCRLGVKVGSGDEVEDNDKIT